MITINEFKIIDEGTKLSIKLSTDINNFIESVLLWDSTSFKDYSLSVDLSYKLQGINNVEEFIVESGELEIDFFDDICFIEVTGTAPVEECPECLIPALGITYDLSDYYNCLINLLIENNNNCIHCDDNKKLDTILSVNILTESIKNSIEIGYYEQAISFLKSLRKICLTRNCDNCKRAKCNSCKEQK